MYLYNLYEYEDLTIEFKPYPRRDKAIREGLYDVFNDRNPRRVRTFPSYEEAEAALKALPAPQPYFSRLNYGFYAVRFDGAIVERVETDEEGDEYGDVDVLNALLPSESALIALADAYFETEES